MASEVLSYLNCANGGTYVDGTVGQGGLARMILDASAPAGKLVGFDRDGQAVAASQAELASYGSRAEIVHANFSEMANKLRERGIQAVNGIVLDLGVSSVQLDDAERGFSFQVDGPLDMRMDRMQRRTAAEIVNEESEMSLARIIAEWGEERFARRIASAIVRSRAERPITRTLELVDVIRRVVPAGYRHGRLHYATRTFQAIRIAVNRELESLEAGLRSAVDVLEPGGRLCVIAFHSLEDRIVKQTFRALASGPDACLRLVTKKPVTPSDAESRDNRRARSAKLRVAERLLRRCA